MSAARRCIALMLATLAALLSNDAGAEPLHPSAERFSSCTLCHGTQGNGNRPVGAPNLAVLEPWYLRRQLLAYRDGRRGAHPDDGIGAEMRAIAASLTDAEITAVVDYVDSFEPRPPRVTIEGDAARGRALYAPCAGCHGPDGAGNAALETPALAGQNDWYLLRQLESYRAGWRGTDAADLSDGQMRAMAEALTDESDLRDVVAYIAQLPLASGARDE